MKEFRVRVIIEERGVYQRDEWAEKKRSRFVKTGIGTTSVFGEDFDEQIAVYDKASLAINEFNKAHRDEFLKGLNI